MNRYSRRRLNFPLQNACNSSRPFGILCRTKICLHEVRNGRQRSSDVPQNWILVKRRRLAGSKFGLMHSSELARMPEIVFHEAARTDFDESVDWYAERS